MKWIQRWCWVFPILFFICMMVMCIIWMMAGHCEWEKLPYSAERWEDA